MDKDTKKALVIEDIGQVLNFLGNFLKVANLNNSDFIVDDQWNLIPNDLQQELLQLTEDDIAKMPSGQTWEGFTIGEITTLTASDCSGTIGNLRMFVQGCCANTLPNLRSLSSKKILKDDMKITTPHSKRPNIKSFMSLKKQYEVDLLGALCNEVCSEFKITKVVDIGTGLGYFGGYMSLMFGFDVLALDSIKDRTEAAEKRKKYRLKQWINLVASAFSIQNGQSLSLEELAVYKSNFKKSSFTPLCLHITSDAQMNTLCNDHFSTGNVMFTALHACGDLSPDIIKLFINCPVASALSIVGCCYNLINEQFPSGYANAGFPMSEYLKSKSYSLGINARSLASQSPDRLASLNKVPPESLYWRALLQVILIDKFGRPKTKNEWKVGKIANKCKSFHEYVIMAIDKLKLQYQITEASTSEYYTKYQSFHQKCLLFYQLRACLGHCIESLIQLDRLLYLLEQDSVKTAHLVRTFDPVRSPRCYAIIAIKK